MRHKQMFLDNDFPKEIEIARCDSLIFNTI